MCEAKRRPVIVIVMAVPAGGHQTVTQDSVGIADRFAYLDPLVDAQIQYWQGISSCPTRQSAGVL